MVTDYHTRKPLGDPTYSSVWSGKTGAVCIDGKRCPRCGFYVFREGGSAYCPKCDDYVSPATGDPIDNTELGLGSN